MDVDVGVQCQICDVVESVVRTGIVHFGSVRATRCAADAGSALGASRDADVEGGIVLGSVLIRVRPAGLIETAVVAGAAVEPVIVGALARLVTGPEQPATATSRPTTTMVPTRAAFALWREPHILLATMRTSVDSRSFTRWTSRWVQ